MSDSDIKSKDRAEVAPSLYVHVCQDGTLYLLPGDTLTGVWGDVSRLKAELARLSEVEGYIMYSIESPDEGLSEEANAIFDLIDSYELESELVDPHPATNNYKKSFKPFLREAIEAAETDIAGTEDLIRIAEQALSKADSDSKLCAEINGDLAELNLQLKDAEYSLSRLLSIELEIATDIDAVEH